MRKAYVERTCEEVTIYFELADSYIRLRTHTIKDTAVYNYTRTQVLLIADPLPEKVRQLKTIEVDPAVYERILNVALELNRLSGEISDIQDNAIMALA